VIGFLDLSTLMTLNDLEPPKFFCEFLDATHFSTLNCNDMARDRPRQPAHEIFTTKRRFQQFKSRLPKFKDAGAGGRE